MTIEEFIRKAIEIPNVRKVELEPPRIVHSITVTLERDDGDHSAEYALYDLKGQYIDAGHHEKVPAEYLDLCILPGSRIPRAEKHD